MTYDELLNIARRLEGKTLETATGKGFKVGVYLNCPFFIPQSTGLGRSDGRQAAQDFLEHYNETQSFRAADHQGVTRNASYFLALIQAASL